MIRVYMRKTNREFIYHYIKLPKHRNKRTKLIFVLILAFVPYDAKMIGKQYKYLESQTESHLKTIRAYNFSFYSFTSILLVYYRLFLFLQAAEKALKAAGFAKDANSVDRRSTDLVVLATKLTEDLKRLASMLKEEIGDYSKMR